jgi:hypothetical protein
MSLTGLNAYSSTSRLGMNHAKQTGGLQLDAATLKGIARGLNEEQNLRWTKSEGFVPFQGKHFMPAEVEINGTKYQAYLRSTSTLVGAPDPKSPAEAKKVMLKNVATGEFSNMLTIAREMSSAPF